jgi:O-antigen/teichoic acid export membrane protein
VQRLRSNLPVLRSVGMLGVAQIVASLLGLATIAVWARFMPAELFGEFRVVLSIATFIAAFCLQGTGQAAMMSAAQGKDGNLWPLIRAKLFGNLLGTVLLLAAAGYYTWGPEVSKTLALGLVAAAVCFPIYNCNDLWQAWTNGKNRLSVLATSRVVNSLLALAAVALAAWLQLDALWLILTLFFLAQAAQNIQILVTELRQRQNNTTDQSLIRYGHHATIATAFSSLLSLDVVLLNSVHDAQQVAIYVLALQFPLQLKASYGVLGLVLNPRIQSAPNLAAAWQAMRRPFWIITALMCLLGVLGYVLLPPVMLLFFSERYAEAADHARLLWLSLALVGSVNSYIGSALLLTKRPIFIYIPVTGFAVLSFALYGLLVPYGVDGMIWARVIAVLALAAFYVAGFLFCLRPWARKHAA